MSAVFILTLVAFFGLALIGMPVAFAMFVASIGYLLVTGRDMGLFGEQVLNGLYEFFRAACGAALHSRCQYHECQRCLRSPFRILPGSRRALSRRTCPGGRSREHHLLRNVRLRDRGCGGSRQARYADDDQAGSHPAGFRRVCCGRVGDHRTDHSAVDSHGDLRRRIRYVGRLSLPRRCHPGSDHGPRPDVPGRFRGTATRFSEGPGNPLAGTPAHQRARPPGVDDANHPALLHLRRSHHANRSRRHRCRLCALAGSSALPRAVVEGRLQGLRGISPERQALSLC